MNDETYKNISSPLDLDLQPLNEYLNEKCAIYRDTNFLTPQYLKVDENVNLKGDRIRLMSIKDYVASIEVNKKNRTISVYCKLGGKPISSAEIELIYNNRTDENSETKYEVSIKKANSKKVKLATFNPEMIYDPKEFRKETSCLCNLDSNEILTFIKQESENTNKYIEEYQNSGKITFGKNDWLWDGTAFIDNQLYTKTDEYGNIKITNEKYIRPKKRCRRKIPKYYPNKKTIKEVIIELFNNINDSWDKAIEPFLVLGFAVITPFYDAFWKFEGMGAIGFIGGTEGGKSELSNLILGIFGADKSFFSASRSTVVGIEQTLNAYNCIPQFVDDISKYRLRGETFIDLMKQIANGMQNNKGKNGQESGALPPCSPLAFSSNNMPCEKAEIFNRMLYINADNFKFNPDKYNYFGNAPQELSCILPHILKYSAESIRNKHIYYKKWLKSQFGENSDRMLSQLAISLSGLSVLSEIADCELNIPFEKLTPYVLDCVSKFNGFKNPLEKILEAFPTLIWDGRISVNNHYKVKREDNKITLSFHKIAICKAYNRYYIDDKSQEIHSNQVKPLKSDLYEIITFNKPVYINASREHGISLDITNHPYATEIYVGKH